MTKLNHTEARILRNLVNNAGIVRWSELSESEHRSAKAMERKGLCWLRISDVGHDLLQITPKGIEALKGPIE